MGDSLWTDWSLCLAVFRIVRCGIVFLFSFLFSRIDVVIILRNEGSCIFLTINSRSFTRLDFIIQYFREGGSFLDFAKYFTKFPLADVCGRKFKYKKGLHFFCIDIFILFIFDQRNEGLPYI